MTEIVLKDIDEVLVDRIRRVAERHGWEVERALLHLLEQGLNLYEGDGAIGFDNTESEALQAALEALKSVPDDPGYALIGRAGRQPGEPG
ncbi:hypothetical protein [Luteimonas sp. R10]|uniref:hypothetical protein n=1 Tax=Luteimonas sp. R10 TaxID=3108176 RepID=UPI0030899207|nr:hypothetical protein U3649_04435 [Luteimonas sp. R10]